MFPIVFENLGEGRRTVQVSEGQFTFAPGQSCEGANGVKIERTAEEKEEKLENTIQMRAWVHSLAGIGLYNFVGSLCVVREIGVCVCDCGYCGCGCGCVLWL